MAFGNQNTVRQFLSSGLSLLRGVTGDDAYTEPSRTPMSEKEFFRAQMEQKWSCINGCC
jgi:uncharacterized short protein YbdD (DUF466 family)